MTTTPTEKWWNSHLVGLDTETTGTNPHEVRIITAAIVHTSPTSRPRAMQWLIHPGQEVPEEAAAVHGWRLPRIEAALNGHEALRVIDGEVRFLTREAALFEIAGQTAAAMGRGTPLVVHNAAYDITLLEAELERNAIDTLASRPSGITGVIDPMVIESQFDPFRKQCYKAPGCNREERQHECGGCRGGKHKCGGCGATNKKLGSLCAHYGIFHAGEHDAAADTLAAIRLAGRLAQLWPDIARLRLPTLHKKQVEWRRDQQFKLKEFFTRVGKDTSDICPEWPVHMRCATSKAVA